MQNFKIVPGSNRKCPQVWQVCSSNFKTHYKAIITNSVILTQKDRLSGREYRILKLIQEQVCNILYMIGGYFESVRGEIIVQ